MSVRAVAVVPARNEAARIGDTVRALRSIPAIASVLVVDDGSTDATSAIAEAAGARVVRRDGTGGKGAALALGVARTDEEIVLFADADLASSAGAVSALVDAVASGAADMAIARFPTSGSPSGFGMVERFARWGIRRLAGAEMRQPLSGQRAMRRRVLEGARLATRFGVDAALTVDALRAGHRVIEIECDLTHARTGRDLAGFAHRARQGIDVALALGARALRRPRRRAERVSP